MADDGKHALSVLEVESQLARAVGSGWGRGEGTAVGERNAPDDTKRAASVLAVEVEFASAEGGCCRRLN